ncbi:MAG: hypothetical protein IPM29_02535 [Planctomycetes bacterium]|nr:hypothetical protein [Planctomycetota bacterium]
MAGHFILRSITTSDVTVAKTKGGTISAVQHANVGWTPNSEAALKAALAGQNIPNRDNLPPHVYLQFQPTTAGSNIDTYLNGAGWADTVERPNCAGLGLRALCAQAQTAWNQGNKSRAVALQAQHGAISVEIYFQAGTRIG